MSSLLQAACIFSISQISYIPTLLHPSTLHSSHPSTSSQVTSQMAAMSVNEEVGHGTIKAPASHDPEADAQVLRKAMKGLGG